MCFKFKKFKGAQLVYSLFLPIIVLFLSATLSSCSTSKKQNWARDPNSYEKYAEIDIEMGESLEPNEAQSIQKVIDEAMYALKRDFRAPNIPRDAHAKSHGCLKGFFDVDAKNLPQQLRLGLFAEKKSYPAWVRFSNNTSDPHSKDSDLDLRGIGVKVMNVDGEKIIENEKDAPTQDFLMFASPIFFVKDIKDYSEFIKALGEGKASQDLLHRPRSLAQLTKAQVLAAFQKNPLRLNYFSASPYRLGSIDNPHRRPVKYSFQPCSEDVRKSEPQGHRSDPNFMKNSLKKSLALRPACFHFKIQVGDPLKPEIYPVEDPSVLWPEKPKLLGSKIHSPYVTVATLHIPQQDFDRPEVNQFCEHLTLTPWHAKVEHRPLGRTNRMRRALYEAISDFRHEANGVKKTEPNGHSIND